MILLLLISGALGIQNGFQTHVTKLPFFPKRFVEALSWILFFGSCWGVRGTLFGIILEVRGVQMGCFGRDFGGLVASLGALGAQFAPGPPGAFQPRTLFDDFRAERNGKGVPK